MADDEIANGMKIVEQLLRQEFAGAGLDIQHLEWGQAPGDFTRNRESLAFVVNGQRRVMSFSDEDLSDAPRDSAIRE